MLKRNVDPKYLQKLRDAGYSIKQIAEMVGISRDYVKKHTRATPKPVKLVLVKKNKSNVVSAGIISISSTVLRKAKVDVNKELYGVWDISDSIRLIVFPEHGTDEEYAELTAKPARKYKLVRNRGTNARIIYVPAEVVRSIQEIYPGAKKFRWVAEGKGVLSLKKYEPLLQKN